MTMSASAITLEERLVSLVQANRHEEAIELARAALKNDGVVEVSVEEDTVVVETTRFRGTHPIGDEDGRPVLRSEGEYTLKDERFTTTFRTRTVNEEARERAEEALEPEQDESEETTEDDEATEEETESPYGGFVTRLRLGSLLGRLRSLR